jgi:hypothetical protein
LDVVLVRDKIYLRVVNVKMWRADSLHAANGRSLHAGPRADPSKTDERGGTYRTASDSVPSYIILALIRPSSSRRIYYPPKLQH